MIKDKAEVLSLILQKFWLNYGIWVEEALTQDADEGNGQETVDDAKLVGQSKGLIELL